MPQTTVISQVFSPQGQVFTSLGEMPPPLRIHAAALKWNGGNVNYSFVEVAGFC